MNPKRKNDVMQLASDLGSSAKTLRGAVRYLITCDRSRPTPRPETRYEYEQREAERTADPEAKRARDDRRFRKAYLARLRRREAMARKYDSTTLDGILQRADSHSEREDEIREVSRLRAIVTGRDRKTEFLGPCTAGVIVRIDAAEARKAGAEVRLAGKDARFYMIRGMSHCVHVDGETEWKNGVPKSYTRATNDNYVRSIGLIVDPQNLDYVLHTTRLRLTLPDGYAWDVDENGLRITHGPDDYHPTGGELVAKRAVPKLIAKLAEYRERRRQVAAENAALLADSRGVYVCLADSVRAGNCRVGTLGFAERHGLDPSRHYPAPRLLEIANGDGWRVKLVIKAACKRHEREEQTGICELADHR